jgi:HSP20 family protein
MSIRDLIPWKRERHDVATRTERADPVLAFQSDVNRIFEDFFDSVGSTILGRRGLPGFGVEEPKIEVSETDKEVAIEVELPGVDEDDVDVSLADGLLSIRAEKERAQEKKERDYVLRERSYGLIERAVPLPEDLDLDSAKARFKNGLLVVSIPKSEKARAAVKRIAVQRG